MSLTVNHFDLRAMFEEAKFDADEALASTYGIHRGFALMPSWAHSFWLAEFDQSFRRRVFGTQTNEEKMLRGLIPWLT